MALNGVFHIDLDQFQERDVAPSDRSFMVGPLSYFSIQPVLHDWCNKGRDM